MTTAHPAKDLLDALGVDVGAPTWQMGPGPYVPIERFGKDHWSTFAYVETRIVDYNGKLSANHLRVDDSRHPAFSAAKTGLSRNMTGSGTKYPTRLRTEDGGFEQLPDHDDVDCLEDLMVAGLLTVAMPSTFPGDLLTGLVEAEMMTRASWVLTERGAAVAGQLRAHKGSGGSFHGFVPSS